jgi:hypothetical protein
MIIMQQDVNLQRRLLHDSFLHPHNPWRLNHGTLLAAGSHQLVAWCPPRRWLPLLSQKQMDPLLSQKLMDPFPPLRARAREKQVDCKWTLLECNNADI